MLDDQQTQLGRLFMAGLPGPDLDRSTLALIHRHRIHNFILFKRNIADPSQLTALCADIRTSCNEAGLTAPLIAIDQEGGSVARLPPPFTQFGDARDLAAAGSTALRDYAQTCARELLACGINMNLAPVLDICPVNRGCIMERRCLSDAPDAAADLGALLISAMQDAGLAACAKHFPGLGSATLDPHDALPQINRTRQQLLQTDLKPFRAAIACEVAGIMTSHTVYPALDEALPATLSPTILTDLLRAGLGFQGVIITDDLEMGAIETRQSVAAAAGQAFAAGADLLLICHDHHKVLAARDRLNTMLAAGTITDAQLAAASNRIAALQQRFAMG